MTSNTFRGGVVVLAVFSLFACQGQTGTVGGADVTPPEVQLTSPEADTVYSSAQVVVIEAKASDNVGVTRVELFDSERLLGSVTAAPYQLNWTLDSSENGVHTLTAKAFDAAGNEATSTPVTVTVELPSGSDTEAPAVTLTRPASPQTITTAQTLELEADAVDNVGVVRVEFYDGDTLLNTVAESPYTYAWQLGSSLNGTCSVTARAYDAEGNVGTSEAIEVTVNVQGTDTVKPTVTLTAPSAGASFNTAMAVTLTATANDDVGVTRVEFFDGATRIGAADTTAPYSVVWNVTAATNGTRNLTARAYDAAANTATSAVVAVTVNISDTVLPNVALTAPAAGASFTTAQTVTLTATASDNVGVTRVEFFDGATRIGAPDTAAPYSAAWTIGSAQNGTHSLTARAYDAAGNVRTSAARSVTVNVGGASTALLTWDAPTVNTNGSPIAGDLQGYRIYVRTASGTYGAPVSINATANPNHTVTGLASGTTYFFTVSAFDKAGNEGPKVMPERSKAIP